MRHCFHWTDRGEECCACDALFDHDEIWNVFGDDCPPPNHPHHVNPEVESTTMTFIPKRLRFFQHKLADYNSENKDMEPRGPEADDDVEYNLVSSLCTDGLHHPCLDIDEDVGLRVVESSTPGHYHLYFDNLALSWTVYSQLLSDLTRVGIVDSKWVAHSQRKGMTTLRPPHVKKNPREVEVWNNSDPFGKTSKEERLIDDFDTPWGF